VSPSQGTLVKTRRNLPHWELGGSTYFLTFRCAGGVTLEDADRTLVLNNWRHWDEQRYLLHCAVVMPDHVHVLLTPLRDGPDTWHSLKQIFHTNKGFTAQKINKNHGRRGGVWQDERHDRIVRDEEEFFEKWNYIANNPVEEGLVNDALVYPWFYGNPEALEKDTGQRPVPPTH
jgi:REP element-mobilizing transposase RayT